MGKKRSYLLLVLFWILTLAGCNSKSGIRIDKSSVNVVQGQYYGDCINLTFHADLTDSVKTGDRVYWSRYDGRFHQDKAPSNGVTLVYEVLNPFGELELKTMSDAPGTSNTVQLGLPVFWSEENPYEYTLRVTFFINAKKRDSFTARFHLTYPEKQ